MVHEPWILRKGTRKENYQKNDNLYASYHEKKSYTQDQQYADDIGWITTNKSHAKDIRENIPDLLKERNLLINADKTERYFIKKGGSEDWKSCKYLGSLLDTEKDIQRRKWLAYDAYNKIKSLVSHKSASTSNKIRRFNAFVSTIFLYNLELHQSWLWFITGGYLVKHWFLPAAARARGQSNDLNREILASNLFNCCKEVINAPPAPSISRCIHIVYRHKNVWEYQWSNFIYNCMSTFLHYVHYKDALLDCSAPGGERCESLTRVDEIMDPDKQAEKQNWCFTENILEKVPQNYKKRSHNKWRTLR